ncbi:MAG: 3-dehydroquinate synthase [Gemmatimonadales bacterium]|nr:MAG: 3-dehydroquinate synthase [Gemmatimonadales bacterium]
MRGRRRPCTCGNPGVSLSTQPPRSSSLSSDPRRTHVTVSGGGGYPVIVAPGSVNGLAKLLDEFAPAHRYAIIADSRVAELHGDRVRRLVRETGRPAALHTFPPGENQKSRERWIELTDALLADGLGRDSCVVALGGGVTGDLAGFVAATFLRGIPVVQLPTSLVAMIDSAVGGKTGVDVPAGKNLVGAFHPPRLVVADPELALTLPPAERAQGLAEALKHGAIADLAYLEALENRADDLLAGHLEATTVAVDRSVRIKADVVSRDEREGGLRQILNFGHTLGHALEACSQYTIPHGSAVARGMVLAARVGEELGLTAPETSARIASAVRAFGLPAEGALPAPAGDLVRMTRTDKKVRGGAVRYVLLERAGVVLGGDSWSHAVEDAVVEGVLAASSGGGRRV